MEIYFKYRRESIVLKILNDLYVSHFLEFQIIAVKTSANRFQGVA